MNTNERENHRHKDITVTTHHSKLMNGNNEDEEYNNNGINDHKPDEMSTDASEFDCEFVGYNELKYLLNAPYDMSANSPSTDSMSLKETITKYQQMKTSSSIS